MKHVVIVGGGISGLVASYVFTQYKGVDVKVLEPNVVGGEFLAGGLKYIHYTDEMVAMFTDLDITFSDYTIAGGIMLKGEVLPYPKCFQGMDKDHIARIRADHYRKTRRADPGEHLKQAMNDPASTKPRTALRCHFPSLVDELADRAVILSRSLQQVEVDYVVAGGQKVPYDFLIATIPLWTIRRMVKFHIPLGMAMKLNVVNISPKRDCYARWDYVYTPYTPVDMVHRFSPSGDGYAVEIGGELDRAKLESDLNFIFKAGWYVENAREGLKGHLIPLDQQPNWPENVAPLGRFAKWDSRTTTDVTLVDAMELAERWLG